MTHFLSIFLNDYQLPLIVIISKGIFMDVKFSNPLSEAFTKQLKGATFDDVRPKSLLKKLLTKAGCNTSTPPPCGWSW